MKDFETVRLTPLAEYGPDELPDLAASVSELARSNAASLRARNFIGVAERYRTAAGAQASLERAIRTGLDASVVCKIGGPIVGLATMQALPLRRLRAPVPRALAAGPLSDTTITRGLGSNVAAWVDDRHGQASEFLADAYRELLRAVDGSGGTNAAWTAEPLAVPDEVHDALIDAGLRPYCEGRFDDSETKWRIPPRSQLYYYQPLTAHLLPEVYEGP